VGRRDPPVMLSLLSAPHPALVTSARSPCSLLANGSWPACRAARWVLHHDNAAEPL